MKPLYLAALLTISLSFASCKKCWECNYPYPDWAVGGGVHKTCDKSEMEYMDGKMQYDLQGKNPKPISCTPYFD